MSKVIVYHGRTVKSTKFSPYYCSTKENSHDQYGIGFYFAGTKKVAGFYAIPDGIVLTCELDIESWVPFDRRLTQREYNRLFRGASKQNRRELLENFALDEKLMHSIYKNLPNAYEQITTLSNDLYADDKAQYLNIVSTMFQASKFIDNGYATYVVYDPESIKVLDVDDIGDIDMS